MTEKMMDPPKGAVELFGEPGITLRVLGLFNVSLPGRKDPVETTLEAEAGRFWYYTDEDHPCNLDGRMPLPEGCEIGESVHTL